MSAPVFDKESAMERIDGDQELLQELAQIVLEDLPNLLEDIRSAIASGDASTVDAAAHKLKGSAGNLGGMSVLEASQLLESMGRAGDLSQAQEAFQNLEAEANKLQAILQTIVKQGLEHVG